MSNNNNTNKFLFNNTPTSSKPSSGLFGSNQSGSATSGLFGNVGASTGSSNPTLFGTTGAASGQKPIFGSTASTSLFSMQTPNKTTEASASSQATAMSISGDSSKSLFSGNLATPAPSGSSLFNRASTTPAGPPPVGSSAGQGHTFFMTQGSQAPAFGALNASKPASSPSATTAMSAGMSLSQQQPTSGLGQSNASKPMSILPSMTTGGSLGLMSKDKQEDTEKKTSTQWDNLDDYMSSRRGLLGTQTSSGPAIPALTSKTSATPSSGTTAPILTQGAGSILTLTKPAESKLESRPQVSSTSAPSTAASISIKGTAPPTTAGTAAPPAAGTTSTAPPAAGASILGASTAGPPPPTQSRLKNKTMDEIITRWATDLTKYQKDFREQAEKVAKWDRMLMENVDRVQKLYGNTVDAERATQEVERQLASVEGQQEELSSWLDRYEREVDEMMSKQVGSGETLQGPDQDRERT
jgi:nuclear pore complex protein Nup62